jgi:hypothetical protein
LVHKISICAQIYKRKWEKREKEKKKRIFWFERVWGDFSPAERAGTRPRGRSAQLGPPAGAARHSADPHVSEGGRNGVIGGTTVCPRGGTGRR